MIYPIMINIKKKNMSDHCQSTLDKEGKIQILKLIEAVIMLD